VRAGQHGRRDAAALAPHEGHTAAYLAGAELFGMLWYLLYPRPRIASRTAGVLRREAPPAGQTAGRGLSYGP